MNLIKVNFFRDLDSLYYTSYNHVGFHTPMRMTHGQEDSRLYYFLYSDNSYSFNSLYMCSLGTRYLNITK